MHVAKCRLFSKAIFSWVVAICHFRAFGRTGTCNLQFCEKFELCSFKNRRLQDICVLMYKVKHTKMCSEAITNIFKPRDSCYSLRNSDFLLPRFNTVSFGKHSLRYLGPILWSKLDKNDKTCKSLSDFRNRMRNKDLTSLIDDGCKGCLLCDT